MASYDVTLERIRKRAMSFGESLQPPCSPESIEQLRQRAKVELGYVLPEQYTRFLAVTNGLEWNGIRIFASEPTPIVGHPDIRIDGFVEANLGYRLDYEPFEDHLVFAVDETLLHTFCISAARFEGLGVISLDVMRTHRTFDEMLADELESRVF